MKLQHECMLMKGGMTNWSCTAGATALMLQGCRDLPPKDDDNKVTEEFVISNINSKLELSPPLTKQDIDICHRLPSNKGKNPVIIKFVRRAVRNEVFNRKSKLKSADSNLRLAITESLAKRRLKLVEEARRAFEFRNVWIMKGLVYCRFQRQRHYIDDFSDIPRIRLGCKSKFEFFILIYWIRPLD